ncbi:MAG: DUF2238 domain-containing protein [Chthoniobacteraceae bacterium]
MFRSIPHQRFLAILGALFAVVFTLGAIKPHHPADWLLENVLVVVFVVLVFAFRRRLIFSRVSYALIFVFLCLHELGSHYTYAEVPYQQWFPALDGGRNHFDRLVHFLYGLLLAYPIREIFLRVADVRGFWGYFLPLDLTMSSSMLYELIEWLAAGVFGGELGAAYLGTQGDVWDAHKDMALASGGALIAMLTTAAMNARLQRDFTREWIESLRVKHPAPLGEDEIARMQDRYRPAPKQ